MFDNYAIIPHTYENKILLIAIHVMWTLPSHQVQEAPEINRAMREQFGLDVTTLGCVYDRYHDDEREDQQQVYMLENHSPEWKPPAHGQWVSREVLKSLALAVPDHRAVLEAWFDEAESGNVPVQRLPWARPGWFVAATAWSCEQLGQMGIRVVGPVEQVKVRMWSSILRIPTEVGDVYFKAAAPAFAYEPLLTQIVSERLPAHSPRVLAVDREQHWMLMGDAGQTMREVIEADGNTDRFAAILPVFARFQIETTQFVDALLASGCPDCRLDRLSDLFDEAKADIPALLIGQEQGLTAEEYAQLRDFTPRVREMCVQLADYHIPATLHHDDFHPGNILVKGDDVVFFDWAESAITHPFFSMTIVIRYAKYVYEYDEEALNHLRDVYLQAWTYFVPIGQLREAFELALRLGTLCRAMTWHRAVAQLEESEKWVYEGSLPYWLKMFLDPALFLAAEP